MYIKRKAKRRLSVWGLIFVVLLTAVTQTLILPCSANIVDGARNAGEEIGGKVSDAARDGENKVEEVITDAESKLNDMSDGKVEDSEGIIGNETNNDTSANDGKMSKVGQIALIVLAVAAIIAVIIIVTIMSHRRKK
ncbi:MAG: hypothetical protein E7670_03820 [Ruminococcaceae bacterium]|nr:hypothetical protein [Oscillospiraceae bacterium]